MQCWHCLRFAVPPSRAEDICIRCFELGSCGLQVEEEGETTYLTAYFEADLSVHEICRDLQGYLKRLGLSPVPIGRRQLQERDWGVEWRRFFQPVWATPRIVVHPSWIPVKTRGNQIAVIIDPQMAFGTGGHESTRLCLRGLEDSLQPGDRCLDVGTGTGVLTIAAAHLGAAWVLAIDTDPRAVQSARQNLVRNKVGGEQAVVQQATVCELSPPGYELIAANLQSHELYPMLAPLRELAVAGGRVLFSGLLEREEDAFCRRVEGAGLCVQEVKSENKWICVIARKVG